MDNVYTDRQYWLFWKNAVADSNFIQVNVDNALNESFKEKSIEPLKNIERKMNSKKGNIWTYWKAYIKMCKSLYYISVNKGNNAKSMLNEAIDMLEKTQILQRKIML